MSYRLEVNLAIKIIPTLKAIFKKIISFLLTKLIKSFIIIFVSFYNEQTK